MAKTAYNKLLIKNRSSKPMILKRAKSGFEYVVNPLSGIGVDVFKFDGFIGIDWESRTVWLDVGDAED